MDIKGKIERLKKLDNSRLIDVVRNYRQYGYSEDIKEEALAILESRGVGEEALKFTGQLRNESYDKAEKFYQAYRKNSKIALSLYILFFASIVLLAWILPSQDFWVLRLFLILIVGGGFITYLIKSFYNYDQFYKVVKEGADFGPGVSFFLFGISLYVLMYFYYQRKMKELMQEIR